MYEKYHRCWYLMILSERDLDDSQSKLDHILTELTKTTISLKQDITGKGSLSDKMGKLIASKLDLEAVIKSQTTLYNSRKKRMKKELKKLKASNNVFDIIYKRKFIDKEKVTALAKGVHYTREYTYELISQIRAKIKEIQDTEREKYKR